MGRLWVHAALLVHATAVNVAKLLGQGPDRSEGVGRACRPWEAAKLGLPSDLGEEETGTSGSRVGEAGSSPWRSGFRHRGVQAAVMFVGAPEQPRAAGSRSGAGAREELGSWGSHARSGVWAAAWCGLARAQMGLGGLRSGLRGPAREGGRDRGAVQAATGWWRRAKWWRGSGEEG